MPKPKVKAAPPGYMWDSRMAGGGRYRHVLADGRLGKMISVKDIAAQSQQIADGLSDRLAYLAQQAVEDKITPAFFQQAMKSELRNAYNANAALGKGGVNQMTAVEWGRNGGLLQSEYQHLAKFAQDIADGKLTVAQAQARARLYGGKAYSRYTDEDARRKRESGEYTQERWGPTVGDDVVCHTRDGVLGCFERAAMGWQPLGTHPVVAGGFTPCLGNCRCPPLSFR